MATQTMTLRTQVKVGKNEKLPPENERFAAACVDIANVLIQEYDALHDDTKPKKDINLNSLRGQVAKKHRLSQQPPLTAILAAVPENYKKAVGARPVLLVESKSTCHYTIEAHVSAGAACIVEETFEERHLEALGRPEVDGVVDAVFVTTPSSNPLAAHISHLCKRRRIPVNVVDAPTLCTFTLLSTHSDGPLQIGITTSGRGCKLSSRIRREISASLPAKFGDAIDRLGTMRRRIWEEDYRSQAAAHAKPQPELEEEEVGQSHKLNQLILEDDTSATTLRTRRMRWLTQICEYWPLSRLAAISDEDVDAILDAYKAPQNAIGPADHVSILPGVPSPKGTITLAGSGPGHPGLLTRAAFSAIETADYILADKLVPAEILALIPRRTPVHIARKFPGNADAAQEEMLQLAITALAQGKHVLRLKQGDPYLYGRGAEEVAFFRDRGFRARVIPGVTSALSAPLFAEIPVTHRAVADEVVVCTGTGRKGAAPEPPEYKASLLVVGRACQVLHELDDGKRWITEEGFRGLDEVSVSAGFDVLRELTEDTKKTSNDIPIPKIQAIGPQPIVANAA
ncbi:putative uroporphyrinogen-III C-methyltransferase [Cyphellophora attinorum]|uniref:precorrin-2 dehydrogenase n=1 Tax=Cyphellophora attinorum TaxID=1664694 RepID=A0A0N1HW24_9EURO|nr:putative uroporphyrinogen-III C-methyltransferase [Phialophora attinorum]KPI44243.1 putative uroporphyrinogen-III C-methyltransferase [Phialophora attinorum]